MSIDHLSHAYPQEQTLLRRLGLYPYFSAGVGWHELGVVQVGICSVKIEVACAPAHFWRFTLRNAGAGDEPTRDHVIHTASGDLNSYWPHIDAIAKGLITIEYPGEGST